MVDSQRKRLKKGAAKNGPEKRILVFFQKVPHPVKKL
jgi:hypothetical protein